MNIWQPNIITKGSETVIIFVTLRDIVLTQLEYQVLYMVVN